MLASSVTLFRKHSVQPDFLEKLFRVLFVHLGEQIQRFSRNRPSMDVFSFWVAFRIGFCKEI